MFFFYCVFFFFQAEDGIRDYKVTGVQTCALPISPEPDSGPRTFFLLRVGCWSQAGCELGSFRGVGKGVRAGYETVQHMERRSASRRKHHSPSSASNPAWHTAREALQAPDRTQVWVHRPALVGTASPVARAPRHRRQNRAGLLQARSLSATFPLLPSSELHEYGS